MIAQGVDIIKALNCAEKVFSFHLPGYTLGVGNTNSPLRSDKIPSFRVYWKNNKWCFNDFGNSEYHGDVIDFIRILYGLSFNEAVDKIVNDFSSNQTFAEGKLHIKKTKQKRDSKSTELDIKARPYTSGELLWWESFGITEDILKLYNVKSCEYIFLNKYPIKCKTPTYAFQEAKDGKISYKLYQPLNPDQKWLNNHNFSVLQGWNLLPSEGELLIVTKSLKDTMLLHKLRYNSISPQSETNFIKTSVLKQLQGRFKRILILYDSDVPGIKEAKRFSEKFNFPYIHTPIGEPKDISDYFKANGEEKTKQLLKQLLNGSNKSI